MGNRDDLMGNIEAMGKWADDMAKSCRDLHSTLQKLPQANHSNTVNPPTTTTTPSGYAEVLKQGASSQAQNNSTCNVRSRGSATNKRSAWDYDTIDNDDDPDWPGGHSQTSSHNATIASHVQLAKRVMDKVEASKKNGCSNSFSAAGTRNQEPLVHNRLGRNPTDGDIPLFGNVNMPYGGINGARLISPQQPAGGGKVSRTSGVQRGDGSSTTEDFVPAPPSLAERSSSREVWSSSSSSSSSHVVPQHQRGVKSTGGSSSSGGEFQVQTQSLSGASSAAKRTFTAPTPLPVHATENPKKRARNNAIGVWPEDSLSDNEWGSHEL